MAIVDKVSILQILEKGMNQVFDEVYSQHRGTDYYRISMPRRGRYQVWGGTKLYADRIKHRKQALAMVKLLKGNDE